MKKTVFIILPLLIILGCRDENDEEPCPGCHNSDSITGDIIAHYMLDGDARDTSINRIDGSLYGNSELASDRYDIPNSAFTGTFTEATGFEGKIDDIVIYKRVLSEEEIISTFDNYSFY